MNIVHQSDQNLIADVTRTSLSLPTSPLGRFLSQGRQLSLNVAVMTTRSNFRQRQRAPSSLHLKLRFIIPVLVNFLQLKYQGKDISPFDTHTLTMWMSIACLLAYLLAYIAEITSFINSLSPTKAHELRRIKVLFGSLSVGSLASVLFPGSVQPFLFLFYSLLTIRCLYFNQLKMLCKSFQQMILAKLFGESPPQERQVRRTSSVAQWFVPSTSVNNGNILPL